MPGYMDVDPGGCGGPEQRSPRLGSRYAGGQGPQPQPGSHLSPLVAASPTRHPLPPLSLKPLARSVSSPIITNSKRGPLLPRPPLRKGKWTPEEEVYAHYIIDNFNKGLINLTRGTTLRSYLSERLNCDPMRVTKKFSGTSCIGKSVFCPCEPTPDNLDMIKMVARRLEELEGNFKNKVENNISAIPPAMHPHLAVPHWMSQAAGPAAAVAPVPLAGGHPPPPGPQSFDNGIGNGLGGGGGGSGGRAGGRLPPHMHAHLHPHARGGALPAAPGSYGMPSRHSAPDLALVDTGSDDDGTLHSGPDPGGPRRRFTTGRRLGPHHGQAYQQGVGRRSRSIDLEGADFPSLTDHAAGDLLVNFFASVHRNYGTDSDHVVEDDDEEDSRSSGSQSDGENHRHQGPGHKQQQQQQQQQQEAPNPAVGNKRPSPPRPERGEVADDEASTTSSGSDQETAGPAPSSPSASSLVSPSSPFSPSAAAVPPSAAALAAAHAMAAATSSSLKEEEEEEDDDDDRMKEEKEECWASACKGGAAAGEGTAAGFGVGVTTAMKRQKVIDGC